MVFITPKMILPMLLIQAVTPVLPTTPGRPWIIFTWVITLIPHGVSGTVITAVSLLGSATVTPRGITLTTTMVTIRRGMPRIITILITLPGDHTGAIAHTIMLVAIAIKTAVTVIEMIVMRGMAIKITTGTTVPVETAVAIVATPSDATRIVQEATIHP